MGEINSPCWIGHPDGQICWSESWVLKRTEILSSDAKTFLKQGVKERLDECQKNGKTPQLYDVHVEKLLLEIERLRAV